MQNSILTSTNNSSKTPENRSLIIEWLTTNEAATYLKIPVGSLRNMTSNGHIPYYKLPGTRLNRYRLDDLQGLLLSQKRGG
jgi:excisionase family DNA binding protein